jgi:accessory gene regulator B
MNILDRSAHHIAKAIRKNNPDAASEELLTYPLIVILNAVGIIAIVLSTSLITQHFFEALIVLFYYPLLRYFSGGFHLKTSISCVIYSSVVTLIIVHINFNYQNIGFILDCISIFLLVIYAPTGKSTTSGIDPKYYPILKIISIILVASNFWIHSSLLSLTSLLQTLTVPTSMFKLVDYVERRITK